MLRVSQLAAVVFALWLAPAYGGPEYFGAIAYSPKSGAHGWAKDHPTRAAAEKAALSACKQHAQDCRPAVWFKNGCGALVVNPRGYYWGWGTTQPLADTEATKVCAKKGGGCKISVRICTAGAG